MDLFNNIKKSREISISRRRFVKSMTASGAALFLGKHSSRGITGELMAPKPPRSRIPNPYVNDQGKPYVVVVSGMDFRDMLQTGLDTLGGLDKLITNNQDVLIKPNCNATDIYPAISDASAIAELAGEVISATTGQVTVGDRGYHITSTVYNRMNLEDALSGTGAELIIFEGTYDVRRPAWELEKDSYIVYSEPYDAPVIINFPCLKRHFLGKMTAGLKNCVGTIEGEWAKSSRSFLHSLSEDSFLQEIAEIAGLINPELTIVDARSALIGNGPFTTSSGASILNGVDLLIMGGDILAVDVCCAELLQDRDEGFSVSMVSPTHDRAHELGLGVKEPSEYEVIYTSTTDVQDKNPFSPDKCRLYQNYPNPFNASTLIRFQLRERSPVTVTVYDVGGRKVSSLLDSTLNSGDHQIRFSGNGFPSGKYVCRLQAGNHIESRTMTLVK